MRASNSSFRRISIGVTFFVITCLIAVTGYAMTPGWNVLDAIYMVVITIFGVGYGEVQPLDSPELKVFTIFVIVGGTSSAIFAVGGFIQMVTEGEIQKALGERKKIREIEQLDGHTIICGFGRIGQPLAQNLTKSKQKFVIVDLDEHRIGLAQEKGYLFVQGNATEEQVLKAAGIDRARVLTTVLPDDALNVFITLTARTLNQELEIIARGEMMSTESKLLQAGANRVVLPADIGALRISHLITQPSATELLDEDLGRSSLSHHLSHVGLNLTDLKLEDQSPLIGQQVSQVEKQSQGALIVVAVKTASGTISAEGLKSHTLMAGETLVVIGHEGELPAFTANFIQGREVTYRGARKKVSHSN